ncbi:extended synaptotagmin-2-like isoform X3 [Euwallacea similis]|uniref:extended synaptotagmin-2-like isoform X3 n=1 Tax=Euwallacea similis TaxID=1736056 RepID=UPI0034500546
MTNTNLIIQISLLYLCYFLGYFRYALAWVILPIVLIVVRHIKTKRLTRKKDFIRDLANKAEKDVVLDAIDGLPSWMQRRHLEKDEWVNEIIKRLWNNVNNYVHNFIKKSLEKGLNKKAGKYGFSGLTVEKLIVGSVPFRVGRLEVLKNGIEDEIILDMDVLYDGNCDIMVKFSKFAASLKDFQMYGRLRMILKPLIDQFPLVGGCQIFFLNPPEVNFSLNGFAGILELPLFNYILKTAVLDIICSTIVLPNKYLIQLSKLVSKEHIQFLRPKTDIQRNQMKPFYLTREKNDLASLFRRPPCWNTSRGVLHLWVLIMFNHLKLVMSKKISLVNSCFPKQ